MESPARHSFSNRLASRASIGSFDSQPDEALREESSPLSSMSELSIPQSPDALWCGPPTLLPIGFFSEI